MDEAKADAIAVGWLTLWRYDKQTKAQIRKRLSELPEEHQPLVRERLQFHEPAYKAKRGIR
ncbi:hypothetical protein [Motilimonas cestriensis]|uniref:hypothetical protein n=1 Tax=Motilimonas cestriensis TaxID=2742685 RepID=UPI003DA52EC8